jgi:hypothetical protein
MRTGVFISTFLLCCFSVRAANVRIDLDAPGYKGERALLYRYLDLFTLRTELIGQATIDAQGKAVLEGNVSGTMKGTIRIGGNSCDLWLRSGTLCGGLPASGDRHGAQLERHYGSDTDFQGPRSAGRQRADRRPEPAAGRLHR